jgi:hypothetical protein
MPAAEPRNMEKLMALLDVDSHLLANALVTGFAGTLDGTRVTANQKDLYQSWMDGNGNLICEPERVNDFAVSVSGVMNEIEAMERIVERLKSHVPIAR